MSDTAPGGEAPGGGVEERESEGGAVTSGSDLVQPSAAAPTADAGASEAAPASTGGEGVAGGEGVEGSVDIDTAGGALIAAPARADDDADDEPPLNMLSFIKVVTQEWPQELKDELARTPDNFAKMRDRLGLRDFCCGAGERPPGVKVVEE